METSPLPPQRKQTASSVAVTSYWPFQGPPFPTLQWLFLFLNSILWQDRLPDSLLSAWTAFLAHFSLCLFFFYLNSIFLFQFHFCCHSFSPSCSSIIYQFLLLFIFPTFLLLIHIHSFSALPVLLRHFSSCTSLPQFSTERQHPTQNFSFTQVLFVFISLFFQFFPHVIQSTLLCVLVLLCSALGNFAQSGTGLRHLPPPLFRFVLLFITICCIDFYLFVLFSCLLMSFLCRLVPVFYSTFGFQCFLALHVIFLPWNNAGL